MRGGTLHGEKLTRLFKENGECAPTIVLTGTLDSALRLSAIAARGIDYVVKEGATA